MTKYYFVSCTGPNGFYSRLGVMVMNDSYLNIAKIEYNLQKEHFMKGILVTFFVEVSKEIFDSLAIGAT